MFVLSVVDAPPNLSKLRPSALPCLIRREETRQCGLAGMYGRARGVPLSCAAIVRRARDFQPAEDERPPALFGDGEASVKIATLLGELYA